MYMWDDMFVYCNRWKFFERMLCLCLFMVMGWNKDTVTQNPMQKWQIWQIGTKILEFCDNKNLQKIHFKNELKPWKLVGRYLKQSFMSYIYFDEKYIALFGLQQNVGCKPMQSWFVIVVVIVIGIVCEHSSWLHAWPNKVHTLHAHASISHIVAHEKLYYSDLYLLYSSHICMFILMSIVHEVINMAT